jgi:hypothetical protein
MATAVTISAFFTQLDRLTNNKFAGLDGPVKVEILNEALLNKYVTLKNFARSVYQKRSTLTFPADGLTVTVPTDMEMDEITADWTLYWDSNYDNKDVVGGKNRDFKLDHANRAIRFDSTQLAGTDWYLEYEKEASMYADVGDSLLESVSPRALSILKREVEYIYESRKSRGQISAPAQSAQAKANQNS